MSQDNTFNTKMYAVLLTVATVMYLILYIPLVHCFIGAGSLTANHVISLLVMLAFATIVYVIILVLSFRAYHHILHGCEREKDKLNMDSLRKSIKNEIKGAVQAALAEHEDHKQFLEKAKSNSEVKE